MKKLQRDSVDPRISLRIDPRIGPSISNAPPHDCKLVTNNPGDDNEIPLKDSMFKNQMRIILFIENSKLYIDRFYNFLPRFTSKDTKIP